jgi:hypothetical protein
MVNKFRANVSLKAFKYTTEQKSISNEINKMIIYFRFLTQRKELAIMGEIIKHDQIIFITQSTRNRGGPGIIMN